MEIKNYISVNGGYVCVQRCSVHLWEDCVGLVGSLVLYFVFSLVGFPSSSRSREKGPDDWGGPLPRRSSILTAVVTAGVSLIVLLSRSMANLVLF